MTPSLGRRPKESLVYDPFTDTWVSSNELSMDGVSGTSSESPISPVSNGVSNDPYSQNTPKTGLSKTLQDSVAKGFVLKENSLLTGELEVAINEKTMTLKVDDTILLKGFGIFLSGLFYITSVHWNLSSDKKASLTIGVIRNGFKDSKKSKSENTSRKEEVSLNVYTLRVGDQVKIVGDAYYSRPLSGNSIIPEWVKSRIHSIVEVSSDGVEARINNSVNETDWILTKFLQMI